MKTTFKKISDLIGSSISIPAHVIPKFKPSKEFVEEVTARVPVKK